MVPVDLLGKAWEIPWAGAGFLIDVQFSISTISGKCKGKLLIAVVRWAVNSSFLISFWATAIFLLFSLPYRTMTWVHLAWGRLYRRRCWKNHATLLFTSDKFFVPWKFSAHDWRIESWPIRVFRLISSSFLHSLHQFPVPWFVVMHYHLIEPHLDLPMFILSHQASSTEWCSYRCN